MPNHSLMPASPETVSEVQRAFNVGFRSSMRYLRWIRHLRLERALGVLDHPGLWLRQRNGAEQ